MNGLILTAAVSGILLLDNTYAGQFLLSEPIFMLPLLSLFKGDARSAVQAGLNLEFLFLGRLAVGASIPPFAGFAAAVFWGSAVYGCDYTPYRLISLLVLAVPAGYWGRDIDIIIRKFNGHYSEYLFKRVRSTKRLTPLSRGAAVSVAGTFLVNTVNIILLSLLVHYLAGPLSHAVKKIASPQYILKLWQFFPVVGVLFLLDRFNDKRNNAYYVLGICAGIIAGVLFWLLF